MSRSTARDVLAVPTMARNSKLGLPIDFVADSAAQTSAGGLCHVGLLLSAFVLSSQPRKFTCPRIQGLGMAGGADRDSMAAPRGMARHDTKPRRWRSVSLVRSWHFLTRNGHAIFGKPPRSDTLWRNRHSCALAQSAPYETGGGIWECRWRQVYHCSTSFGANRPTTLRGGHDAIQSGGCQSPAT